MPGLAIGPYPPVAGGLLAHSDLAPDVAVAADELFDLLYDTSELPARRPDGPPVAH